MLTNITTPFMQNFKKLSKSFIYLSFNNVPLSCFHFIKVQNKCDIFMNYIVFLSQRTENKISNFHGLLPVFGTCSVQKR